MHPTRPARDAFTLLEILIVIGIIGILIALLLPAIQAAREAARRRSCANNLAQLAIAVIHYESMHETLPPGTIDAKGPIASRAVGYHMSWMAQILPFVEQSNAFRQLDFSVGAYHPTNYAVRRMGLNVLRCPSAGGWVSPGGVGLSNYAACHHDVEAPIDTDNHGVFHLNSFVGFEDIFDGRASTIFFGEKSVDPSNMPQMTVGDLGWLSGTRAMLRNTGTPINTTSKPGGTLATMVPVGVIDLILPVPDTGPKPMDPQGGAGDRPVWGGPPGMSDSFNELDMTEYQPGTVAAGVQPALVVGGFESRHPLGAQFAFGDGSVRFLAEGIDPAVYRRMGHRADGELIDDR
jgi:prepilin-type N-terminal cleavage/methylation domain-containing protein/prepilin-type processing-associated H-X9-DG protein